MKTIDILGSISQLIFSICIIAICIFGTYQTIISNDQIMMLAFVFVAYLGVCSLNDSIRNLIKFSKK